MQIFDWLSLVAGLAAAAGAIYAYVKSADTLTWTRVTAQIIESSVHADMKGDAASYEAVVKYRYHLDGNEYTGNRIRIIGITYPFKSNAEKLLEQYPAGREVAAYINPAKPSESVLVTGAQPIAAVLLFLLGLGFVWFGVSGLTSH